MKYVVLDKHINFYIVSDFYGTFSVVKYDRKVTGHQKYINYSCTECVLESKVTYQNSKVQGQDLQYINKQ
jgi:hypothetical protein